MSAEDKKPDAPEVRETVLGVDADSVRDVQAAQAAHARELAIARLCSLHPVVRELVEERDALRKRVEEAESQEPRKKRNA